MSGHDTHGGNGSAAFKQRVAAAIADEHLAGVVDRGTRRQDGARRAMLPELGDSLAVRELAARIKNHTLQNLDQYLAQFVDNVRKLGGHVHFAETGEQACEIIAKVARDAKIQRIVKSKSMVSEEVELDAALQAGGFEVVETDLGEYILQIGHERPFHLVVPAVHKSREDIGHLFADKLGIPYTSDPEQLTAAARQVLREKFRTADMGITGANFAIAETGAICILTNEGNGRFCTSRPRVLVTLMGVEKVIPRMRDLAVFLKLLGKSATGQRVTSYTNLIAGPRRPDDADGPQEFHLVIMDRGRTGILGSQYRSALRCIRCGACLNACPVYRKIGGHAYGTVYPGPIGSLVSPLLNGLEECKDLPQASSLCGACLDACPVRIDIPTMLIEMRGELQKRGRMPLLWTIGFKFWRLGMSSKRLYRIGAKFNGWAMRRIAPGGWLRKLPGPGAGWTEHRDFPVLAPRPFRDRWAKLQKELDEQEPR